jgi:hypothetical protein
MPDDPSARPEPAHPERSRSGETGPPGAAPSPDARASADATTPEAVTPDDAPAPPIPFDAALPGDVAVLGPAGRAGVAAVYRCRETVGGETVEWAWLALEDGRLLEVAPRGCALYDPPIALAKGSARYHDLVAQDGALVRFEERVRAGTWEDRPVRLTFEGRRWRVTATGTVAARRLGGPPPTCWGQLGELAEPERADEPPVYFTLARTSDPDAWGLGLWATDVCLAFGRRLGATPAEAGVRLTR